MAEAYAEAYAEPTPGFSHISAASRLLLEGLSRKAYAERRKNILRCWRVGSSDSVESSTYAGNSPRRKGLDIEKEEHETI
jgi:hypothetical protein